MIIFIGNALWCPYSWFRPLSPVLIWQTISPCARGENRFSFSIYIHMWSARQNVIAFKYALVDVFIEQERLVAVYSYSVLAGCECARIYVTLIDSSGNWIWTAALACEAPYLQKGTSAALVRRERKYIYISWSISTQYTEWIAWWRSRMTPYTCVEMVLLLLITYIILV